LKAVVRVDQSLTRFDTPSHSYLLVFLGVLNTTDLNNLKNNPAQLRRLFDALSLSRFLRFGLDEGSQAAQVFKVKLRHAKGFAKPLKRAVVIGDAAANPRPQSGSGLNSGVASLPALGTLVHDLANDVSEPEDAFDQYNQSLKTISYKLLKKASKAMAVGLKYSIIRLMGQQPRSYFYQDALRLMNDITLRQYASLREVQGDLREMRVIYSALRRQQSVTAKPYRGKNLNEAIGTLPAKY
jgi:2-polyprenyl-6-methoxyphenol hydroxylase-like FAD-dependent oxidoreductase